MKEFLRTALVSFFLATGSGWAFAYLELGHSGGTSVYTKYGTTTSLLADRLPVGSLVQLIRSTDAQMDPLTSIDLNAADPFAPAGDDVVVLETTIGTKYNNLPVAASMAGRFYYGPVVSTNASLQIEFAPSDYLYMRVFQFVPGTDTLNVGMQVYYAEGTANYGTGDPIHPADSSTYPPPIAPVIDISPADGSGVVNAFPLNQSLTVIPEPATVSIGLVGLGLLVGRRFRRG